jgi:hypothetical protein
MNGSSAIDEGRGMNAGDVGLYGVCLRWFFSVRSAVAALAACAVALLVSAPAFAGWGFPKEVGSAHNYPMIGVTVDPSSGDLYAGNLYNESSSKNIFAFNAKHQQLSVFGSGTGSYSGVAFDPVNGDLYAVDARNQEIQLYSPATGEQVSPSFSIAGSANVFGVFTAVPIAADSAGNVYLPNAPHNEVQVFDSAGGAPSGGVASTITGSGANTLTEPTGVAVDSSGNVWVADHASGGRVEEFTPAGVFVREIASEGVQAVAVDASGDVFASVNDASGAHVIEYDTSGAKIDDFGLGVLSESFYGTPNAIAIDEARSLVYVADDGHKKIWVFSPLGVSTGGITNVTETQATLEGSVEPGGTPTTSCLFEYGTSTSYGHTAPCSPAVPSGEGSVPVSAELMGLEANVSYHYRLVAGNKFGTVRGEDKVFVPTTEQFGFQTSGPNAFSVVVSNSEVPSSERDGQGRPYPAAANPRDLDTQAGSHPYAMTVNFRLKTTPFEELVGQQFVKDIWVNLPAGFAGSIVSVPQCPMHDLDNEQVGCPTSSQVGVVTVWEALGSQSSESSKPVQGLTAPVYNMVPSDGGTAELSFPVLVAAQPVIVKVRTDGDYGLISLTNNISNEIPFDGVTFTLWGTPADPRHDPERFLPLEGAASFRSVFHGRRPGNEKGAVDEWGEPLRDSAPLSPYLTNPTHCGGPLDASITADSWADPGRFNPENDRPDLSDPKWLTAKTAMYSGGITGCDKLEFDPSINVAPDTAKSNSPSGYAINLHVPQSNNPNDLAAPALENAVATLPQGLAINPGAADGLEACTSDSADPAGSPGNEIGLGSEIEPTCPMASQVGSVELRTPLLPEPLFGQVYLSSEHEGNKYGVFVVIRGEGLLVKLHSTVVANAVTGQLTASFLNNPELPFSDFTMHFYGGPRAVFVNPTTCGPAATTTDLTSWASVPGGLGDVTPSSIFDVSFDGNGAACPSPQPFTPEFRAGTTSIQAGGFSPLTTTFSRPDEDQLVNHVQVTAPPGLLGTLRNVPLCPEPQASLGTCSAASKIGHTIIGVGSGAAPLYLPVPGQPEQPVYVTGPYRGAPFGLTFVVPAVAGPYNLGNVVVRAAIDVDPKTAQLTVTSDPLPTIIDGIPVQVKTVNVVIDRPDFVFNPTNCSPMSVGGSVTSLQGSTAVLSSPFQVTGCGDLKFKPRFSVSTSGHPSRADGASLDARLSFSPGALGREANIATVKVDLPKQLPSRLETLKQACTAATFASDPSLCPKGSIVGVAKAVTPTLPDTLTGPVYFVSHGGEEFPSLIIVLQGDGVRVDLTGTTFINEKTGITSSTFKTVPDVPVETFELYLPQGHYSALAAPGKLCNSKLVMPTVFTAQNGLTLRQNTPIAVTGCTAKARRARSAREHKRRARNANKGQTSNLRARRTSR